MKIMEMIFSTCPIYSLASSKSSWIGSQKPRLEVLHCFAVLCRE